MAKGGKRPGAGRPTGSTNKPSLRDYMKKEDIEEFFEFVLSTYKESEKLTVWMRDQLLGKAAQSSSGPDGGPIQIESVEISFKKLRNQRSSAYITSFLQKIARSTSNRDLVVGALL